MRFIYLTEAKFHNEDKLRQHYIWHVMKNKEAEEKPFDKRNIKYKRSTYPYIKDYANAAEKLSLEEVDDDNIVEFPSKDKRITIKVRVDSDYGKDGVYDWLAYDKETDDIKTYYAIDGNQCRSRYKSYTGDEWEDRGTVSDSSDVSYED